MPLWNMTTSQLRSFARLVAKQKRTPKRRDVLVRIAAILRSDKQDAQSRARHGIRDD